MYLICRQVVLHSKATKYSYAVFHSNATLYVDRLCYIQMLLNIVTLCCIQILLNVRQSIEQAQERSLERLVSKDAFLLKHWKVKIIPFLRRYFATSWTT